MQYWQFDTIPNGAPLLLSLCAELGLMVVICSVVCFCSVNIHKHTHKTASNYSIMVSNWTLRHILIIDTCARIIVGKYRNWSKQNDESERIFRENDITPSVYRGHFSTNVSIFTMWLLMHTHVRPFVWQTPGLWENEIIVCRYFNTIRHSDVLVFWGQILWSWVEGFTTNDCVKEGYPSVEIANLTNNLQ